ncbi:MAG: type IV pilin-like G/H family protein, partial [Cyanobacteria bacterium P01_H01_bin.15]
MSFISPEQSCIAKDLLLKRLHYDNITLNVFMRTDLKYHCSYPESSGFTLIELLVVVIIVGLLAAIALPNLFFQIARARESEARLNLGAIARSQQAFHYEKQFFFNGSNLVDFADVNLAGSTRYNYTGDPSASQLQVTHLAIATSPSEDRLRDYAINLVFDTTAEVYVSTFCVSNAV